MNELLRELAAVTANFNGLDWVITGAVVVSMAVGIWRGFAREALSLLGWISAFVLANLLALTLADSLRAISDSQTFRYLLSWLLVFIGVLAIFSVLGSLLAKQLRQPGLNLGNRLAGGAFGVARGLVVMMAVTLVLKGMLPDSEEDWLDDAELMPTIDLMADWFSENFDDLLKMEPVEKASETIEAGEMI